MTSKHSLSTYQQMEDKDCDVDVSLSILRFTGDCRLGLSKNKGNQQKGVQPINSDEKVEIAQ
ncbi:hypothetical protein CHS0354_018901 [Potamilus streckersoni]|uniref:Uncharacterized protein n=1 Tax=Potamilus streckersoni TaxID=2493646 RepID=A0AAE0SCH7_9BIVA|nr:hypothetical protein CHS0354_018901 [Potamilus streckersoni]